MSSSLSSFAGTKRARADSGADNTSSSDYHRHDKKYRPTIQPLEASPSWHYDTSTTTPLTPTPRQSHPVPKYDSDDQSSMVSEPGSPQDISMSSDDDDDENYTTSHSATYSHSPEDLLPSSGQLASQPWRDRLQRTRVPTPFGPSRPSPLRTNPIKQHIRSRHPQENHSDHLDVPSPVDEDEVPTPPSAAEAAGSQLSMLTVSDVDMDLSPPDLPAITVDPARGDLHVARMRGSPQPLGDLPQPIHHRGEGPSAVVVRKQRQRSCAQSNGSVSPARLPSHSGDAAAGGRRGFSMGFRADCDKCRARVPGHMNHFVS